MNAITRAMVSITGHQVEASTKIQDVAGLSKIGLSICFASALAALQFGVAGWYLSSGLGPESQWVGSFVMGVIGACVVLIIDRNFIYAADTSPHAKGAVGYLYLGIRVFLIFVISSLSSQFTLPLLLKSELEIHVQDLRDERYDISKERYDNKYELSEKVRGERELNQKITKLKASLANLPQNLVHQKLASEQCFREYKKKINASIGPDVDDEEVTNLYARDKIRCEQLDIAYKESYRLYVAPKQAELVVSEANLRLLERDVTQAQISFKNDLQKADSNNSQFLNASSADVLWSLISHNPGARMKYLMITLVQLILELMPLLLKSLLGRSPLGLEIALRQQQLQDEFEQKQHENALDRIRKNGELKEAEHKNAELGMHSKIAIQQLENELNNLKGSSWMRKGSPSRESAPVTLKSKSEASMTNKLEKVDDAKNNPQVFSANLYAIS